MRNTLLVVYPLFRPKTPRQREMTAHRASRMLYAYVCGICWWCDLHRVDTPILGCLGVGLCCVYYATGLVSKRIRDCIHTRVWTTTKALLEHQICCTFHCGFRRHSDILGLGQICNSPPIPAQCQSVWRGTFRRRTIGTAKCQHNTLAICRDYGSG